MDKAMNSLNYYKDVSIAELGNWNTCISEAICSVKTATFPDKLEHAIRQLVDFDICMIFAYSIENPSYVLHHNLSNATAKIVIDDYLEGPYLLDPFYGEVVRGKRNGFGTMRSFAPDQFYRSEFYRHHYVRTGIADEVGLFFPISQDTTAVLSITRQEPKKQFSGRDKRKFASTLSLVKQFASVHWTSEPKNPCSHKDDTTIEIVFDSFGLGVLTSREKQIVALILKGHSSASIGQVLAISEGTVKIHRKHAYGKLEICSQAELFSMFLASLRKKLAT